MNIRYIEKKENSSSSEIETKRSCFLAAMEKKIIGICGEEQKKWIAAIPDTWQFFQETVQILILDDQADNLSYLEKNPYVSLYTKNENDFLDKALKIIEESKDETLVILNGMEVAAKISKSSEQYELVHKISQNSTILCTNLENRPIRYQSPQLLQEIKTMGQILFFGDKKNTSNSGNTFWRVKTVQGEKK